MIDIYEGVETMGSNIYTEFRNSGIELDTEFRYWK